MANKKVETIVTPRAAILFNCIAITNEVQNVQNMLFMKKGDVYMDYCSQFPKKKIDYPLLRAAIESDLALAPVQQIERISTVKGERKAKIISVYPWGEMSIKMKAHSLAVSILKTYQRRSLKFGNATKLENVTLFQKYSDYGKESATNVNKTVDISKKSVHKSFDEKKAYDFLNSFLKPVAAPKAKKAA